MSVSAPAPRAPALWAPLAAIFAAMVAITAGASFAKRLFPVIGPEAATSLRLGIAAVILGLLMRVWRLRLNGAAWRAGLVYGFVLGTMNLMFYQAIARVPLGIALAIEFLGPLAVAVWASRRASDLVWVGLAGAGVLLVLQPGAAVGAAVDPLGLGFALAAGAFWGAYILAGQRAGVALGGAAPAVGMAVGAVMVLPVGLAHAGPVIAHPWVLGWTVAVAVLSSAIPYSLEMYAMRRLPTTTFGILTSGEPAVGALAGLILLGEHLGALQWLGIAAVVSASLGTALSARQPG